MGRTRLTWTHTQSKSPGQASLNRLRNSPATRWQRDIPEYFYGQPLPRSGKNMQSILTAPQTALLPFLLKEEANQWTVMSIDVATGEEVTSLSQSEVGGFDLQDGTAMILETTMIAWDPDEADCGVNLTAYDLSAGGPIWTRYIGQWQRAHITAEPVCTSPGDVGVDGSVLLTLDTNEYPQIIDSDSGQVTWSGSQGDYPLITAGDVIITRADHAAGDLVGYNITTNEKLWNITFDYMNDTSNASVNSAIGSVDNHLAFTIMRSDHTSPGSVSMDLNERVTVYDPQTGEHMWTSTASVGLCGMNATGVIGCQGATAVGTSFPAEVRFYPF